MCACVCLCVFLGVGVGGITLRSSLLLREGEVQKKLRTLEYSGQGGCPLPSFCKRTIGYPGPTQDVKCSNVIGFPLEFSAFLLDIPMISLRTGPIMIETF